MIGVNELLVDHQLYHSDFQMDHFITIRAGGTVYGQYKQALRELDKRKRGLKQLYSEKALLQIDIDELDYLINKAEDSDIAEVDYELERNRVKCGQKVMTMEDLDRNIKDTEREFVRFYSQAASLKEQIGELTPERRKQLDEEMWAFNLKKLSAMDVATTGNVQKNTLELIMAAPMEIRMKTLEDLKPQNRKAILEWLEQSHEQAFEVKELLDVPVQKLLEGD
jgi:predicted nucleic acid-binding OB-fold protein